MSHNLPRKQLYSMTVIFVLGVACLFGFQNCGSKSSNAPASAALPSEDVLDVNTVLDLAFEKIDFRDEFGGYQLEFNKQDHTVLVSFQGCAQESDPFPKSEFSLEPKDYTALLVSLNHVRMDRYLLPKDILSPEGSEAPQVVSFRFGGSAVHAILDNGHLDQTTLSGAILNDAADFKALLDSIASEARTRSDLPLTFLCPTQPTSKTLGETLDPGGVLAIQHVGGFPNEADFAVVSNAITRFVVNGIAGSRLEVQLHHFRKKVTYSWTINTAPPTYPPSDYQPPDYNPCNEYVGGALDYNALMTALKKLTMRELTVVTGKVMNYPAYFSFLDGSTRPFYFNSTTNAANFRPQNRSLSNTADLDAHLLRVNKKAIAAKACN